MKKNLVVFVSGVTGQTGSYMVDYLLEKYDDIKIYGGVRRLSVPNHKNIKHINDPRFKLVYFDLTDTHSIDKVVRELKPDYFINFAAQSFVGASWDIPIATWDAGATSVIHILEALREHSPKTRFYNAGCHDTNTKVVTKDGVKKYTEIKEGDLVYTINENTKDLEFKSVRKIFEYDYEDDLIELKNGGLLITPNHKVIYKTKKGNVKRKIAEDFIKLSDVKYPINNPLKGVKLPENVDLSSGIPEFKKVSNKTYGDHVSKINAYDLCYLIGLYIGDGSSRVLIKKHKISKNGPQRDTGGKFIEVNKTEDVEYKCPLSVIDIPPTDEAYSKLIDVLDRNNIKWSLHGQCDVTFCQWGLVKFFDECGKSAQTKNIPEWIFDLDHTYQKKVLEGIIDSDGDNRGTISTVSNQLIESLCRLYINCGIIPHFSQRPEIRSSILKDGRIIKGNFPENTIHGMKVNTGYQKGNFKKVPYKGKVWCLEIEDNHNFLIERNGKLTFSGNSSEEFGDVQFIPQSELHPIRPRSPYGAAKAAARNVVKVYRESYNIYAVQGWLFNHESERRGEEFVTRKITQNVARIHKSIKNEDFNFSPLELGNIDAQRDWSHAKDFVRGVWMMLNQDDHSKIWKAGSGIPIDYVLSSGFTHSVRHFVEKAFAEIGVKGVWTGHAENEKYTLLSVNGELSDELRGQNITLMKVNPKFYRPAEVDFLKGYSLLARTDLGWEPEINFEELVSHMVRHDIDLTSE